ncbi:hypothetical protein [Streptomyces sp. NPDC007346]|uniref:hypothetical protein n=1 Tax=Streptomyces sp. NPDC007346 TaxID=3154682 RepID=UPI0034520A3F
MEIEYSRRHETQVQLARAYQRLGHTPKVYARSAILLIDPDLTLLWACRVLKPAEVREEDPAAYGWHVIAEAGELDWPPLRPEDEIWPALLARHPIPTGDTAEHQARMLGKGIEEMHRDALRYRYLGTAHIGRIKRNSTDINFSPLVRDWDATARELAEFIDTHRPPRLTTEQRVMAQGVHLAQLEAAVTATKAGLSSLVSNASREQGAKPRWGFKADMHRWSGVSRPTVDAWLTGGDHSDDPTPTHPEPTTDQERPTP